MNQQSTRDVVGFVVLRMIFVTPPAKCRVGVNVPQSTCRAITDHTQLQAGKKHWELFEKHRLQRDRLAAEQNEELRRHLAQSQNVEEGDEDSMWM